MISLSVIKVKVKPKSYILSCKDLHNIRELISGVRAANDKDTKERLDAMLAKTHSLDGKVKFTLRLDEVSIDPDNLYVTSSNAELSRQQMDYMVKLIRCALSASGTILVFPDYIHISSNPPDETKPKKRRKKDVL